MAHSYVLSYAFKVLNEKYWLIARWQSMIGQLYRSKQLLMSWNKYQTLILLRLSVQPERRLDGPLAKWAQLKSFADHSLQY